MNRIRVRVAAVVLGGCLAAWPAAAQEGTSQLRGRVTDSQAGALPGVTVTVTNQDSGTFREALSSATARGSWPRCRRAAIRWRRSSRASRNSSAATSTVAVGNQVNVDMQLELGGVEETVTVTAQAPLIDVTSKEIGGNITTKELVRDPEHRAQLHLLRRPAARHRADREPGVVGIGHADGQRRRLPEQQLSRGRRLGQRRLPRAEQRRPGARAARRRAGVPGAHRAVRRGVRPHLRRDRQRRDQVRHQQVPRQRLRVLLQQGPARHGFLPGAEQPRQGRHRRRTSSAARSAVRSGRTRCTSSPTSSACG